MIVLRNRSAYSGTSRNPFLNIEMQYLMASKKKNALFVWGLDIKVHPSRSPFVITRQASWCQKVILETDFSISPSHSWWILIYSLHLLRNEFNFWNVHGMMNTSGLLQSKWSPKASGFTLTLQETRSIHDSMNRLDWPQSLMSIFFQ